MGLILRIFAASAIASAIVFCCIAGSWAKRYAEREAFVARPIGVGDRLHIEVYDLHGSGGDEIADLQVGSTGSVRLPGIDTTLMLASLSVQDAGQRINEAYLSHNPNPTSYEYRGWPFVRFWRPEPPPVWLNLLPLMALSALPTLVIAWLAVRLLVVVLRRPWKSFKIASTISVLICLALSWVMADGNRRDVDLFWHGGIGPKYWLGVDGCAVRVGNGVRCAFDLRPPRGAALAARQYPGSHEELISLGPWRSGSAILPLAWLIVASSGFLVRRLRRRRQDRLRSGLCRNCGYDLRATPHRCPECGVVPRPATIHVESDADSETPLMPTGSYQRA